VGMMRLLKDFFQPKDSPSGPEYRKRVEWLMLLRLVVTNLLLAATIFFHLSGRAGTLGDSAVFPLYILIGATFFLGLLYAVATPRVENLYGFSLFQCFVDVAYYTVLVYFTGGAWSAFTPIYIFPIISSGILHFRRGAIFTATVASILFGSIINLEYLGIIGASDWPYTFSWGSRTIGYVLWFMVVHFTVFFLTAIMSSSLAEQLQRTRVSLIRTEQDYQDLTELHSSIVHSIPSGIVTTNSSDIITFVNSAGAETLQANLGELIGHPLVELFPIVEGWTSGGSQRQQTFATTKQIGDDTIHLQITVSNLTDKQDIPSGRLVVFWDVTQLKKMEERVKRSEKLSAFLRIAAGLAHEIRNPLAALRGATELLSMTPELTGDEDKLYGIILRESDRINALLTDFVATVRMPRTPNSRIDLSNIVADTVELFSQNESSDDIILETLVAQGLEIEGNEKTLKRAIWNLLSNASDASPKGGVVKVTLSSDDALLQACLTITDFGSGILPEIKDRMFEPFSTTKDDGTGLGLPFVLSVVEAHNGTIDTESSPVSGTAFTIRIPLAQSESYEMKGFGS
jgi:two-component system sensor histidine kinase PilS (NtrC family)